MLKQIGLWGDGKSTRQEHRKSLYKALGPECPPLFKKGLG